MSAQHKPAQIFPSPTPILIRSATHAPAPVPHRFRFRNEKQRKVLCARCPVVLRIRLVLCVKLAAAGVQALEIW